MKHQFEARDATDVHHQGFLFHHLELPFSLVLMVSLYSFRELFFDNVPPTLTSFQYSGSQPGFHGVGLVVGSDSRS